MKKFRQTRWPCLLPSYATDGKISDERKTMKNYTNTVKETIERVVSNSLVQVSATTLYVAIANALNIENVELPDEFPDELISYIKRIARNPRLRPKLDGVDLELVAAVQQYCTKTTRRSYWALCTSIAERFDVANVKPTEFQDDVAWEIDQLYAIVAKTFSQELLTPSQDFLN